ncbi:MAG TPA: hypothetical protein DD640_10500 [Clostridiales bacterium]|nr:hypothetical protein [Clostridiales bacterium]
MGYTPNRIAQGLARRKSGALGLVVPDIESMFYGKIVRYVDDFASRSDYQLILAISNDRQETEQKIIRKFLAQQVEGIIITPVNGPVQNLAFYQELQRQKVPFAFLSSYYAQGIAPCVMADLRQGTQLLTGHLLAQGCRNIYFLTGLPDVTTTLLRVEGFRQALSGRQPGFSDRQLLSCSRVDYADGYDQTIKLLRSGQPADAILAINDEMALGALNAANCLGIRVPDQLAIAGCDNVLFSSTAFIPITTLDQNIAEMCRVMVNCLDEIISQPEKRPGPGDIMPVRLIEPVLIVRNSSQRRI